MRFSKEKIKNFFCQFHIWVFIATFFCGIVFGIVTPIAQEADGAIHFFRAYDVAKGNLFLPIYNHHDQSYMDVPKDFDDYVIGAVQPDEGNGAVVQDRMKHMELEDETTVYPDPREFPAIYYYGGALGLKIGFEKPMSVHDAVVLAHIINALIYAFCAMFTAKYMPIGKVFTSVIMLSPICIFQAASMSYDCLLNGLCFLVVALSLHWAFGTDEELGVKQMLPIGVILAVIYMSKYVYVIFGLLVFLIPMSRFGSKKKYFKTLIISLLPIILYVGERYLFATIMPPTTMEDFVGMEIAADDIGNFAFALQNPIEMVKILLKSFYRGLSSEFITMNTLGWGTYTLWPIAIILPPFWAAVLFLEKRKNLSAKYQYIIVGATIALIWLGVVCGLYFMDPVANPTGYPFVRGLQGRYFIMCLPLLSLLVPKTVKHEIKHFEYKSLAIAVMFCLWSAYIFYERCIGTGILNFY